MSIEINNILIREESLAILTQFNLGVCLLAIQLFSEQKMLEKTLRVAESINRKLALWTISVN